ncbi:MAG: FtsQ-type POTRA domain-containing protein [Candidatus Riflebacteria bacterium]|nr:FtsQ-type POTRA domain-containing protein [Candidatus Riflebacteria bacterium]
MPEDFARSNRAYLKPTRPELPTETREKLRRRQYRTKFNSFARLARPARALGFVLLIAGLCYLVVTQLRHLFFATSYFEIKTLEVIGNKSLNRENILKTAGLAPGLNLFKLDREEIKRRILTEPLVKDVKVDLDGLYNLKLIISERTPFLYAKVGTAFYEISDDGVIINTQGYGEKDLPLITGLNLETSQVGDNLNSNDGYYIAHNWVKSLESRILEQISEINFKSMQNPYLILLSGEKVFPRSLEDFKNRYDFLRALLDNLRKNNVEPIYLDMRAPNQIVVRPRKSSGSRNRGSIAGG